MEVFRKKENFYQSITEINLSMKVPMVSSGYFRTVELLGFLLKSVKLPKAQDASNFFDRNIVFPFTCLIGHHFTNIHSSSPEIWSVYRDFEVHC